jgi:hypothetical protein
MKEDLSKRERAEALIEYFARLSKRHPKEEEYSLGLSLAERWLSLMAAPKPEAAQIEALVKDVEVAEARDDAGSWTVDLSLSIQAWARSASAR